MAAPLPLSVLVAGTVWSQAPLLGRTYLRRLPDSGDWKFPHSLAAKGARGVGPSGAQNAWRILRQVREPVREASGRRAFLVSPVPERLAAREPTLDV